MTKLLSVRAAGLLGCLAGGLLIGQLDKAQDPETSSLIPMDDITERTVVTDHRTLSYQPIREADILWERRLWRLVDVREKMNHSFTAPESPLFKIIFEAALSGELPVYSTENDRFTKRLPIEHIQRHLYKTDTILTYDIDSGDEIVDLVNGD